MAVTIKQKFVCLVGKAQEISSSILAKFETICGLKCLIKYVAGLKQLDSLTQSSLKIAVRS